MRLFNSDDSLDSYYKQLKVMCTKDGKVVVANVFEKRQYPELEKSFQFSPYVPFSGGNMDGRFGVLTINLINRDHTKLEF